MTMIPQGFFPFMGGFILGIWTTIGLIFVGCHFLAASDESDRLKEQARRTYYRIIKKNPPQ
jgi:hypothetical protein